jgi:hypothetical protein
VAATEDERPYLVITAENVVMTVRLATRVATLSALAGATSILASNSGDSSCGARA